MYEVSDLFPLQICWLSPHISISLVDSLSVLRAFICMQQMDLLSTGHIWQKLSLWKETVKIEIVSSTNFKKNIYFPTLDAMQRGLFFESNGSITSLQDKKVSLGT